MNRSGKADRRVFLAGSLAAAAVTAGSHITDAQESKPAVREYYELRTYRPTSESKKPLLDAYLKQAMVPALNRMGVDRIGVFTAMEDPQDQAFYVLIPYVSLESFASVNDRLAADSAYAKAAGAYLAQPLKDPVCSRIESRFMRSFSGMPKMELPDFSPGNPARIFELRIYESHDEAKARRKVDMFNEGEIDIMRRVRLGPLFFGETLVGNDLPNLTYMLAASGMEAHKEHWQAFRTDAEWGKMKVLERYKDTVSKIISRYLAPVSYSQI